MTDATRFEEASIAIGRALDQMALEYAIIGGVACSLHQSFYRSTIDLDLVVDVKGSEIREIKTRVATFDDRFRQLGNSLYFEDLPIEMLPTDHFGWPHPLAEAIRVITTLSQDTVKVLSPTAIIVSKLSRAALSCSSTRPKTVLKFGTDMMDINEMFSITMDQEFNQGLDLYSPERKRQIRDQLEQLAPYSQQISAALQSLPPSP